MARRAGGLPGLGREFAVERAREAGVTKERLRGDDLIRPFHGVRVLRASDGWGEAFARPGSSAYVPPVTVGASARRGGSAHVPPVTVGASARPGSSAHVPPVTVGASARPGSSAYVPPVTVGTDDVVARCRAFATVMAPDAAFSHVTAAILHGIPIPWRLDRTRGSLHVLGPRRASAAVGVIGHQSTLDPLDVIDARDFPAAVPVTSPERTLCDLAPLLSLGELVAAADRVLFHGAPLATRRSIAECVSRHRARRGRPLLLRAVALASELAESPRESLLRVLLIEAGLPAPTPQVRVRDAWGREIARVDLAYPEHRIAIEYEGDHHRTDRKQWRRDLARIRDLGLAGWETLRTTPLDLDAPAEMLLQLRYWLTTRAPTP
jgi:very-short-patch-repair endonuclease